MLKQEEYNKIKKLGQTFTPPWLVDFIINESLLKEKWNCKTKILEPSFGKGAFLKEIVLFVINEMESKGEKPAKILNYLNNNIYGFEIDQDLFNKCILYLNGILKSKNLKKIKWKNLKCDDALKYIEFDKFDFILGNPPYISVQNINNIQKKEIKEKYKYTNNGAIDTYLSFFEMSLTNLKETGILGFVTPNTYFRKKSSKKFRDYLSYNHKILKIVDYSHFPIFDNVSTYSCVSILGNNKNKHFSYDRILANNNQAEKHNIFFKDLIELENWPFYTNGLETFDWKENTTYISFSKYFGVRHGLATLSDKIFISEIRKTDDETIVIFNNQKIEKAILKKVIKGSNLSQKKEYKILFPYEKTNGQWRLMNLEKIQNLYPLAFNYLKLNKVKLMQRSLESVENWYGFGRSQAISLIEKDKLIFSPIFKENLKFFFSKKGTLSFSSINIFVKKTELTPGWATLSMAEYVLSLPDFLEYIKPLSKNQRGGYLSLSTKTIEKFKIPISYFDKNNL